MYPDRLFLNMVVVMVVRRLPRVHILLAVLEEPTPEMRQLRALLPTSAGASRRRRTWERRLARAPAALPAQIAAALSEFERAAPDAFTSDQISQERLAIAAVVEDPRLLGERHVRGPGQREVHLPVQLRRAALD